MTDTRLQRLARLALGTDPVMWVETERAKGRSWAAIAADLTDRCGGGPPISRETVRLWTRGAPFEGGMKFDPAKLRMTREQMGLSQLALGLRAHISNWHISQLEAGALEARPDTVARLAAALGCPTITLLAAPSDADCQDPPTH